MKSILGVEQIDYRKLLQLVRGKLPGTCSKATITTNLPFEPGKKNGVHKDMKDAGFGIVMVPSDSNDATLFLRMLETVDPCCTQFLALVGSYQDALAPVCKLAQRGVKVLWFGTTAPSDCRRATADMSPDMVSRLMEEQVTFFDLRPHRKAFCLGLLQRPTTDYTNDPNAEHTQVVLHLRSKSRRVHLDFGNALLRLQTEFPELVVKVAQ